MNTTQFLQKYKPSDRESLRGFQIQRFVLNGNKFLDGYQLYNIDPTTETFFVYQLALENCNLKVLLKHSIQMIYIDEQKAQELLRNGKPALVSLENYLKIDK